MVVVLFPSNVVHDAGASEDMALRDVQSECNAKAIWPIERALMSMVF